MKHLLLYILLCLLGTSCSHTKKQETYAITTANLGIMKNHLAPFPVYLMDHFESRTELEKKYSKDIFVIHTGHLLKANLSKSENEKTLNSLAERGINLINLTLEDFIIADRQGIKFEKYPQAFLNSTIIDINQDSLVNNANIRPYFLIDDVAFIGLSDDKVSKSLSREKFIIDDYVLAILKVKKTASAATLRHPIKSFIVIHNIGEKIDEVMSRLPPSFLNSLAN